MLKNTTHNSNKKQQSSRKSAQESFPNIKNIFLSLCFSFTFFPLYFEVKEQVTERSCNLSATSDFCNFHRERCRKATTICHDTVTPLSQINKEFTKL